MLEKRGCLELVYLRETIIAMSEQSKGAVHFFAPSREVVEYRKKDQERA
jgi:hypothetical protein